MTEHEAQIIDASKAQTVNDGLQNLVTSMGVDGRDSSIANIYVTKAFDQNALDTAYRNWLMKKCVDIPVDDAFRKDRFVITGDGDTDTVKRFYDLENALGVKAKFVEAAKLGRLYGGAVIIIGTSDLDWKEPIKETSAITHLVVLGRYEIDSVILNTANLVSPNYREPGYYKIGSNHIHYTRVIQFDGDRLPFNCYQANANWHGSVVQRLNDAIEPAQSVIQNCATLVNQLSTDVFKTPGFFAKLASLGEESAMIKRFQTAAYMRSNLNMMVLDSEEEYVRLAATLTGLPDTMFAFMRVVSGAADIPETRLFGDSASGLNATGQGDQRNYYDHVAADQNTVYGPRYGLIDPLLCRAIWGGVPEGFRSQFEPLWQMSDSERAEVELKRAQRDTAYLTAEVVTPAIVARQLQEDETYTAIDEEYIDALESYKEPEPVAPVSTKEV